MSETLFGDTPAEVIRTASLSDDLRYRYTLTREWGAERPGTVPHRHLATFVMLNPSDADAERDDPTIQTCMKFARAWGLDGIRVVNLYAYRASQPAVMWTAHGYSIDIIGPDNDAAIMFAFAAAEYDQTPVIAAWGNGRTEMTERVEWLCETAASWNVRLSTLGTTLSGAPKHPLARGKHRIPVDQPLVGWPA